MDAGARYGHDAARSQEEGSVEPQGLMPLTAAAKQLMPNVGTRRKIFFSTTERGVAGRSGGRTESAPT